MKRSSALFFFVPALLIAGTVTRTLNFSPSEVNLGRYEGYDVVELARGQVIAAPGKPALPEVPVVVSIPASARVTGVVVMPLATAELPGTYNVVPGQQPRPISRPGSAGFTSPDPAIYETDDLYPADLQRKPVAGSAAGFRVASVLVSPLQYRPASGRLALHTRLAVTVEFEEGALAARTLTPDQRSRAAASLRSLVANPEDLDRFGPSAAGTDQRDVAYLVITNDLLAQELRPVVDYRTARGLRAELRTVEWIDRNYPGRDLQEKIRNLIIDYFEHRGLSYVLLAGDNAQVPCRTIRIRVGGETGNIPTDLYYGDLDHTWDSNNNDIFGEMSDEVDLYADVLVGRASVDNARQARNFLAKVGIYESRPATDYVKRSLLPSGWLWRSIGYHGKFVNDSIADITPTGWTDVKMENPPGANVVADSFSHGFAMFDPAGHGNSSGVYDENGTPIYVNGNAFQARNYRSFSIMTSLACDPGEFDAEDCLAENAMNCDTAGCIGVMMNSRYGWGTPPSMGPSEKLCVRFYDFFFERGEYGLGACHSRSREEYAGAAQWDELWRWCMTEFNLFGDPALNIYSDVPGQIALVCPDSVPTGAGTIDVTVTRIGLPLSGATVCASKGDEVFAVAQTSGSGTVSLSVHPRTTGALSIAAVAHNAIGGTRAVSVIPGAAEPYIVLHRASIDDGGQANPNGVLEPGERGALALVVRNDGTATAWDARVLLRPASSGVVVIDSTADLGTIAPADTALTNSLSIVASPDAFPGSTLLLTAQVTSGGVTWEFEFGFQTGYPGRLAGEVDTGECALSVTARGALGFDCDGGRRGRGFRFPESDTSSLNIASFVCGTGPDYVVDRFYARTDALDRDWVLVDSVRQRSPLWNADQVLSCAFSDAGHATAKGLLVSMRTLGNEDPSISGAVILVYDVRNVGTDPLSGLHAGILADFDVRALDRLHDIAGASVEHRTAYMRNVVARDRYCGVRLLSSDGPCRATCIDHARYVYPDSGMSEDMKLRSIKGELGTARADRPYNWSVAVGTGPVDLAAGECRRFGFAMVAAPDSMSYLSTCSSVQQWYDANVGITDRPNPPGIHRPLSLSIVPNPAPRAISLRCNLPAPMQVRIRAYDAAGRLGECIHDGMMRPDESISWVPLLPQGVYLVRIDAGGSTVSQRVVVTR